MICDFTDLWSAICDTICTYSRFRNTCPENIFGLSSFYFPNRKWTMLLQSNTASIPADIDSPLLRICRPAASPRWGEMDRSLDCYILLISILLSTIWKQWEHQHLILFPYIPIDQHRPLLKKDLRSGPLINSETLGIYSILLS